MWKKAIIIVLDVVIAVYLVLALTAFNKPDEEASVCSEVRISIEQTGMDGFLTQRDVQTMLKKKQLYPLSQPMARRTLSCSWVSTPSAMTGTER